MQMIKWLPVALLPLLVFAACSGDNTSGTDAGKDSSTTDAPANGVNQTGQIVDFSSKTGLPDVTISNGSASATTDAKGNYTLAVAKDTPYTMTVSADGYLTLHEQEWKVSGDVDRGQTLAVSNGIEAILKNALSPIPDPTLAVLSVNVVPTGSCTSAIGATISVPGLPQPSDAGADAGTTDAGSGGPHLVYFAGGFPTANTSVTDTGTPSAVIYDLPAGMFSQITVSHPTCTMVAFPVADPTITTLTYTGNVTLAASGPVDDAGVTQNVASFMRVFLK